MTPQRRPNDEAIAQLVEEVLAARRPPVGEHLTDDECASMVLGSPPLDPVRQAEIGQHLPACVECVERLDELFALDQEITSNRLEAAAAPQPHGTTASAAPRPPHLEERRRQGAMYLLFRIAAKYPAVLRVVLTVRRYGRVFLHSPGFALMTAVFVLGIALAIERPMLLWVLPAAFVVGIRHTLRTLSPPDYARVQVLGRPGHEVVWTIADHIDRLCRDIERRHNAAQTFERRLLTIANAAIAWDRKAQEFRDVMAEFDGAALAIARASLNEYVTVKRDRLDRIEEMKSLAAVGLSLPPYGLCDHVLHYVPSLHRRLLQKYVANLDVLRDCHRDLATERQVRRFAAIVRENWRLRRRHEVAREVQRRLKANYWLLGDIVELAQAPSPTDAVRLYSRTLARVAREQARVFRKSEWHGDTRREPYPECEAQFRFVHHAQRINGAIDLADALTRAIDGVETGATGFRDIARLLKRLNAGESPLLLVDPTSADNPRQLNWLLSLLEKLPFYTERALEEARWATIANFGLVCRRGLVSSDMRTWIVTYGFSHMVRDVLKHGLLGLMNAAIQDGEQSPFLKSRDLTRGVRRKYQQQMPSIYLLHVDARDRRDTAQMTYELKEQSEARAFASLTAGSSQCFLNLVEKADRVLFVLGADCFDHEGRVVRSGDEHGCVRETVAGIRALGIASAVVVVAQAFKQSPLPLSASEVLDRRFLWSEIQNRDDVDMIVAGHRVFLKRQAKVASWLDLSDIEVRWSDLTSRVSYFPSAEAGGDRAG